MIGWSCNSPADSPYAPITFVKKTTMSPTGRAAAVAFVINEFGYVALGRTAVRSSSQYPTSTLNDCWKYDPVLDSWTQTINTNKCKFAIANHYHEKLRE